jgi:DNA-binding transcriptional MerR regulator
LTLSYNSVNMWVMIEASWTLDELAERVDAALAVGYDGQPSGRVRDVPDRRAIRWYTTIGLVDRPAAHRGRTAMYGQRHLLQLVAVKRLQARGLPLVAIQQELAGATDTQLARVARLPTTGTAPPPGRPMALAADREAGQRPRVEPGPVPGVARQASFWRERPTTSVADGVASLRGVRLGERATLLLDPVRPLDQADLDAILDAARPLLDALRARGLDRAPEDHRRTGDTDPGREHP